MNTLVENVKMGDTLLVTEDVLEKMKRRSDIVPTSKYIRITGFYPVNGEGIGFVARDNKKQSYEFSKSCGTYVSVIE